MKKISENIKYLSSTDNPLSAEVYFINGDNYCYIYDVGNNKDSLSEISNIKKDIVVILSHYHEDHTGNINKINYHNLYVGELTYDKIGQGSIIKDRFAIKDGSEIEIRYCPSPHVDGCLIVTVNKEYTLIADLYFTRPPFNKTKVVEMIEALKNIDTKFFVISHEEDNKVIEKIY